MTRDERNAKRRQRYATDEHYRQKVRERSAATRAKNAEKLRALRAAEYHERSADPQYREHRNQQQRDWYARTRDVRRAQARERNRAKYRGDPAFRATECARVRGWRLKQQQPE